MKKYITLFLLFLSTQSFAQQAELQRAIELNKQKKHAEAIVLFEQLLNKQYGPLDENTQIYCMALNAGNYYALNNYKKAYEKYDEELKFLRTIKKEDDKNIKALVKFMEELKSIIPDFNTPSAVVQNTAEANSAAQAAPTDKTVTLTVSGQGKTKDEAKQNALRSAIEQAFGTFISSNTQILNDNLVKDEVVSVSNGNIKNFEILSEVNIPDGGFATSLKATVSVTKLTSFVESKGGAIEFKGNLFTFNIKQQILNEKNELQIINDLLIISKDLMKKSFNYDLSVGNPQQNSENKEEWTIPFIVSVKSNENFLKFYDFFIRTLEGASMTIDEAKNYESLGKKVFPYEFIEITGSSIDKKTIILRNEDSALIINMKFPLSFVDNILSISINDDNGKYQFSPSFKYKNFFNKTVFETNFQPISFRYGPNFSESSSNIFQTYELVFFDAGSNSYNKTNQRFGTSFNLKKYTKPETEIVKITIPKTFTLDEINKLSNFKVSIPL